MLVYIQQTYGLGIYIYTLSKQTGVFTSEGIIIFNLGEVPRKAQVSVFCFVSKSNWEHLLNVTPILNLFPSETVIVLILSQMPQCTTVLDAMKNVNI